MYRAPRWAAIATLLVATACASTSSGTSSGGRRNVITAEQMSRTRAQNAYEAVELIEPQWLGSRGPQSLTDPGAPQPVASVFLNGVRVGDTEYLRNVQIADVAELRYFAAGEASARFGMGHIRGVIEIVTKGLGK